jgi:hypothetical protein
MGRKRKRAITVVEVDSTCGATPVARVVAVVAVKAVSSWRRRRRYSKRARHLRGRILGRCKALYGANPRIFPILPAELALWLELAGALGDTCHSWHKFAVATHHRGYPPGVLSWPDDDRAALRGSPLGQRCKGALGSAARLYAEAVKPLLDATDGDVYSLEQLLWAQGVAAAGWLAAAPELPTEAASSMAHDAAAAAAAAKARPMLTNEARLWGLGDAVAANPFDSYAVSVRTVLPVSTEAEARAVAWRLQKLQEAEGVESVEHAPAAMGAYAGVALRVGPFVLCRGGEREMICRWLPCRPHRANRGAGGSVQAGCKGRRQSNRSKRTKPPTSA